MYYQNSNNYKYSLNYNKRFVIDFLYNIYNPRKLRFEEQYTRFYCMTIFNLKNIQDFKKWIDSIINEISFKPKPIYNIEALNDILMYPLNLYKKYINTNYNLINILNEINNYNLFYYNYISKIFNKLNLNTDIIDVIIYNI